MKSSLWNFWKSSCVGKKLRFFFQLKVQDPKFRKTSFSSKYPNKKNVFYNRTVSGNLLASSQLPKLIFLTPSNVGKFCFCF
jgi:hypothetical protein